MKHQFFNSILTALPTSPNDQPLTEQPTSHMGNQKKLYALLAIALAAIIVVAAVFFVPQSSANTISLGVHYTEGEKITYDITIALSSDSSGASASVSANSTVTVEVISIEADTYKLNFTTTTDSLGLSTTTSKILEVKESQMVTALALLPVAFQQYTTIDNTSNPLLTAVFDQSTAKVGDTWNIPLDSTGSSGARADNLTVTFKAIQDLTVPAGNYNVFRIDLATNMEESQSNGALSGDITVQLTGQCYLETGSCKQIQSNLVLAMSMSTHIGSSDVNYKLACSVTSNLVKDVKA